MSRKQTAIAIVLVFCFSLSPLAAFTFEYNESLSKASDITLGLTLVTPGVLGLIAPPSDYIAIVSSYAGTMVSAYGVRTVLKQVIHKPRPYVGQIDRPADTSEDYESFPSGHSIMAFSAAAYAQTMQLLFYPDSTTMKAVSATTWILAATTATLRVISGNHYLEDVLAGAAIGSAIGFLGPYLTYRLLQRDSNAPHILAGPVVGMQVSF
ncbi:MAG: phosphatase PAP2 family protein [Sphaerochaeta associata]|jgi:membrane-associated phospholipid phosphatase|uniref:phosphatase PAP2 family protein n=1 Tax=Sphaerochaeta associata TaxID=1129264 RepID=UPI002B213027|nr:phosphatase PAP2 family protein [Sphaerochaeta associata]MEA5029811.1 phosphatase PAP2 family protein [Sphaerochaeta associata]